MTHKAVDCSVGGKVSNTSYCKPRNVLQARENETNFRTLRLSFS